MRTNQVSTIAAAALLVLCIGGGSQAAEPFVIEAVDAETGRGVPLVELSTTNNLKFVTDSAGLAAITEPDLLGQTVHFQLRSHGYEFPADGFGIRGRRLKVRPGETAKLEMKRLNVAERLYRTTGTGIYRDTVLAGRTPPIAEPLLNAQITGQDSMQPVLYREKLYWFWGDTGQLRYPLGNFRMAGAVSRLPGAGGLDPSVGVNYEYFKGKDGFSRAMVDLEPREGVVWVDGVFTVPDSKGRERMLGHFSRRRGLETELEHGLVLYNDTTETFERFKTLEKSDRWRFPHGHPLKAREGDTEYFYFGIAEKNVRVKADWESVLDPAAYEAWTPLRDYSIPQRNKSHLARDAEGRVHWRWSHDAPPLTEEHIKHFWEEDQAEDFATRDCETGKPVRLHGGSIRWNEYRKKYVLIAVEIGGTSFLGEVWYGEAEQPTGPWERVRKIVTHERYSFYNPVHHPVFDQEGGRLIYFEGTYTREFSGNQEPTPRYDYNQVMYRLDLADPRLAAVREPQPTEPQRP